MKTNKIKKIQVPQSGFKSSRFNWSHDVNTTFGWGEVQPTQVKLIQPNSKTIMSTQELIRLAPMPSPTFGRIKYKTYNQFVPIAEIFTNYDRMIAQEPVSTAFGTKVPQALPSIILGRLSSYCVHGARATLYYADGVTEAARLANYNAGIFKTMYRTDASATPSGVFWDAIVNNGVLSPNANLYPALGVPFNTGSRVGLIPALMVDGSIKACYINALDPTKSYDNPNKPSVIPLANKSLKDLFPIKRTVAFDPDGNSLLDDSTMREVTMDGADYLIDFSVTYNNEKYYYCLALEFSDFGKRIRKVLQGCGYQIDLSADYQVSLIPLFAQYKAYFEVFGLTLYQGWETTWCSKVLESIDQCFIETISNQYPNNNPLILDLPNLYNDYGFVNANSFIHFMLDEVGNEWYTEEPDWIGSHINKLAVSPRVDSAQFISVDSAGVDFGANIGSQNTVNPDGTFTAQDPDMNIPAALNLGTASTAHSFINQIIHSQVDADLLKRMYRWTNRNTILGRSIEKLLRAQNLGDYVDQCKSYYIGASDNVITISDVVSQSATADAVLGEYGGQGLQYLENHNLVYENDVAGYWVTLACVVPASGYTQGLDPTLTALRKFELYNSDFDAIGYMLTPKSAVCASRFVSKIGLDAQEGKAGFGFTPMYSNFKVCQNLANGDFNRHNQRNKYLSYTLDKQLSYNDYDVIKENYDDFSATNEIHMKRTNTLVDLAVASNVWRTPTKYPWLGNFSRIFYNMGEVGDIDAQPNNFNGYLIGWDSYNSDNFLSHAIYDVQCYAHMKPIEESYGLGEDTNPTSGVSYTTKA